MNTQTAQDLIETAKTFCWRAALEGDPNEGGDRKLAAQYAAIAQAHAATAQAMIDLDRYEDERIDAEREERRKIWSAPL